MAELVAGITLGQASIAVMLAGTLALALALALLAPRRREVQVFVVFLVCRVMLNLGNLARSVSGDPAVDAYWARVAPYYVLPLPLLLVMFLMEYPSRPRAVRRRPWLPWLAVGGILLMEALYLLDHRWYGFASGPAGLGATGPLGLALAVLLPGYALAGLVVARAWRRAPPGPARSSMLLVSVGFVLDVAFLAAHFGVRWAFALGLDPDPSNAPQLALWVLSLLPVAAVVGVLLRGHRASPPADRRAARRGAAAIGLASLTGIAAAAGYAAGVGLQLQQVFDAAWTLALPALVGYGLLRYRLFDIDLRVKRSIRRGTVVIAFVGILVLSSQLGREALPPDAALFLGIAATAGLVLVLARLQRFADLVADRALPGVREDPAYLDQRRLEVYRAALDRALDADGTISPREEGMLAALRAELGVTERDDFVLRHAARAGARGPESRDLRPGEVVLGKYKVARLLGRGAHGTTYLAEDRDVRRSVALKVLDRAGAGEEALREARALGRLRHPRVVGVFDVHRVGDQLFLAMEFAPGGSLADRLRSGPLGRDEFDRVARGLLDALGEVHRAGLLHRDVKPSNVLLGADGEVLLGDFGVARQPGLETTAGGDGAVVGTVRFMSPEQAKGKRLTPRSDLFSAAATLYEAYTGKPYLEPGPSESAVEVQMRAAAGRRFEGPAGMAPALRQWFARALHPDPARRFAGARPMRQALDRALAAAAPQESA